MSKVFRKKIESLKKSIYINLIYNIISSFHHFLHYSGSMGRFGRTENTKPKARSGLYRRPNSERLGSDNRWWLCGEGS